MSKQLARKASALLDQLSNASGRTVDTLYASFIHKLGLSSPFFKASSQLKNSDKKLSDGFTSSQHK